LELATINPVAVFGPLLGPCKSPSLGLLDLLISGAMKAVPNIPLNVVDVRDVANLHIRAMRSADANGQRFIASANGEISLPEIAILLKNKMPDIAAKVSLKTIPNWVLHLAALFSQQAKQADFLLTINRKVSNAKAKRILDWIPMACNEEAILASMDGMIRFGMINERS